tara:strand:- start:512 stop:3307 length:2796 start_codon:yes stop_codon:yes gene_type:complete
MCICCFDADTEIKLSNGEVKKIKDIKPGDQVLGMDKKVNTVKKVEKPIIHFRNLYSINDTKPFTTAEHPFKTPQGWSSIKNNRSLFDADTWANFFEKFSKNCKKILPGTVLINDKQGKVKVEKITPHKRWKDFFKSVYNLQLDGNNTFYANNYLVHNKGGGGTIGKIIGGVVKVFKKTVGKIFDFIGDVIGFVFKPFGIPDIPDFSAENSASGVKLQKPGTNVGFPVVYGFRRVGSVPVYAETNGSDNQDLYVVYAICEGEIEGIRNIKVDGNSIGNSTAVYTAGQELNAGYPYDGGRMVFQCFNGTENQTQSSLMSGSASWGNKQRTLPGLAYVAARFRWIASDQTESDRNPFGGGIPALEFDVYGKKVYDLATHSGGLDLANDYANLTKTYSTNPANCLLDILMNPRYGAGYDKSFINADSFKTVATKFNQTVVHDANDPANSTAKIITCNGVLNTESEILQNVKKILSGCRTMMPFVEGRYKLKVEDGGHPTDITSSTVAIAFDVTADHIVGAINLSGESKESKYNQVLVNYIDPDEEFSSQQEFFNTTGDLAIDDNETLTGEFTFDTMTNRAMAKDFARLIYQKSRNQRTIAFSATQELMNVEVGDVIRVTDTVLNLNQATFRVVAMTLQNDSTVRLEGVEHDATIYPHISTPQKEIAPQIFKPNTVYNYVRTASQNAAPENYNNGTTSAPPLLTYQLAPQVNEYSTATTGAGPGNVTLPNTHQLVDQDSFVLQHKDTSKRILFGGAIDIQTNQGYRPIAYNNTQVTRALNMQLFVSPPKGFLQFEMVIDIFQNQKRLTTIRNSIAVTNATSQSPGGGIFGTPQIQVPVTRIDMTPIIVPLHPAFSYQIRYKNSTAGQSYVVLGDTNTWSGFTNHQYKVNGKEFIDTGLEGMVNYVANNYAISVAQFPNGSNFVAKTGGSVNMGGTP